METKHFEKIYTRDTTYIMQELWAHACGEGMEKEFGWKNPHLPGIIHFMNEGSIEIWENIEATKWLQDKVLEKNSADLTFIDRTLEKYKTFLRPIHNLWKESPLSIERLDELIKCSKEALPYFVFYYYSAVDERTPNEAREKALEMREKDEFFAKNDAAIRTSILNTHPELKGFETTVFIDEIESTPSIDILRERRVHSIMVQGQDKQITSLEDFAKNHSEFNFATEKIAENQIKEFKGQIAQKGKTTGVVKILRRRDQLDEVTAEHVIVSPMTTPDFLPAMERAKAFVTDEGGITCHAGIVARELKKPCIIGTKIATQVLKDGDMVEVDADKGIVRKI